MALLLVATLDVSMALSSIIISPDEGRSSTSSRVPLLELHDPAFDEVPISSHISQTPRNYTGSGNFEFFFLNE